MQTNQKESFSISSYIKNNADIDPATLLQYLSDEIDQSPSHISEKPLSQNSFSTPEFPSSPLPKTTMVQRLANSQAYLLFGRLTSTSTNISNSDTRETLSLENSEIFSQSNDSIQVPNHILNLTVGSERSSKSMNVGPEALSVRRVNSTRHLRHKKWHTEPARLSIYQKKPGEIMRRSRFASFKKEESEVLEPHNNEKIEKSSTSITPKQERDIDKLLDYCHSKSKVNEGLIFKDEGRFTTFRISDLRDFLKNSPNSQKD